MLSKESSDATESVTSELDPPTLPSSQATESDPYSSEAVSSLNVCLVEIGETPFSQSRAQLKTYCRQKVKKITEALQCTIITGARINDELR